MVGLPKKKLSKARQAKRKANNLFSWPKLVLCPRCQGLKLAHRVCPSCGYYRERLIIEPKETTKVTRVSEK